MGADGDAVLALPRSAALDAALVAFIAPLSSVVDGEAQEVNGLDVLRTHESWIFAAKLDALEPWRAPARYAARPAAADAWCAGSVGAAALARDVMTYAAQLPDIVANASLQSQAQDENATASDPPVPQDVVDLDSPYAAWPTSTSPAA